MADGRPTISTHVLDLATGEASELELHEDEAWLSRLASLLVSEAAAMGDVDGVVRELRWSASVNRLYLLTSTTNGTRDPEDDENSLQIIDPQTGRILEKRSLDSASFVAVPPDTQDVLMSGASSLASQKLAWTEVLSAETLQSLAQLDGWRAAGVHSLAGQPVLLVEIQGEDGMAIALIDGETYDITGIWSTEPGRCSLVLDTPVCQAD